MFDRYSGVLLAEGRDVRFECAEHFRERPEFVVSVFKLEVKLRDCHFTLWGP